MIIGSIGACGQAYLLHHKLVDCYPYKITNPHFYRFISEIGVYAAPIVAIIGGLLLGLKRFWLTVVAPVVLCPLTFASIFKIFSFFGNDLSNFRGFDGKTPESVTQEFVLYTLSLSLIGLFVAVFCNFLLLRLSKPNKLA
ncbi:MAG: hypothetical protein K1X72_06465 [Pyrinomonadaceae bacterium]|nr:hypothetical protein [Pyrinomonadaceae bacterium]